MTKLFLRLISIVGISVLIQVILTEDHLTRCRREASSSCILTPETTQGPYYWNTSIMRQNITEDRPGVRFRLHILVTDVDSCLPIPDAAVVIWHCDALGLYSHYIQASQNYPDPQNDNRTFLRGIQLTNTIGIATFDTIYPGWYYGRATHIHIKVYLGGTYINESSYYSSATYVHTGQLFFNDTLSNIVDQQTPYNTRTGSRTLNDDDGIYGFTNGYTLMNIQYVNSESGLSGGLITTVMLSVGSAGTTNSESTFTDITDNESTFTEITDNESTFTEITDNESTSAEITNSESTYMETTNSESTSTETTNSKSTSTETTNSESTSTETTNSKSTSTGTTNSESTSTETTNSKSTSTGTTNSESTSTETTNSSPISTKITYSSPTSTKAINNRATSTVSTIETSEGPINGGGGRVGGSLFWFW